MNCKNCGYRLRRAGFGYFGGGPKKRMRCDKCGKSEFISMENKNNLKEKEIIRSKYYVEDEPQMIDMELAKVLCIPDTHTPDHDEAAVKAVLDYISVYDPDWLIHMGDVGEFSSISYWNKNKRLLVEGMRLRKEIDAAIVLLNRFADNAKPDCKKVVLLGNHEDWINKYIEECPELQGAIDIDEEYRNIGWQTIPPGKAFQICENLLLLHGHFASKWHTRITLETYGISCLYAHTHDRQEWMQPFYEGEKSAQSIGCLRNLDASFLKGKPSRWTHGFATIDIWKKKYFYVDFIKIVNGIFFRKGEKFGG